MKAQAYLTGRGDADALDSELYFVMHTGKSEKDVLWEALSFYPQEIASPYRKMLEFSEGEQNRLFLPAYDTAFPDATFSISWNMDAPGKWTHSSLSVKLIPDRIALPTIPSAYARFSYLVAQPETKGMAEAMLAQMVRSLVLLHTRRVYHDFHDGYFGVAYNNLLERLWYNFAVDAAVGMLGVCEHCGAVFEATAERKDRKRFCSTDCQEYAKSARNYRKRKIRELLIAEGGCDDVDYLLHVLDDPKITREMVEGVLGKR